MGATIINAQQQSHHPKVDSSEALWGGLKLIVFANSFTFYSAVVKTQKDLTRLEAS